jgi:competence protein ComEA
MFLPTSNHLKKEGKVMRAKKMVFFCIALAMVMAFCAPSWAGTAGKINLNKATAAELSQLKGIGMKYAERIVEFRDKNGPFKQVEDLLKVQGIGPKTLEKNKDRITVK